MTEMDQVSSLVFPTCVGVFLARKESRLFWRGLPHVRGGVSIKSLIRDAEKMSSPRAWGCFSIPGRLAGAGGVSSPRVWGCFFFR